MTMQPFLAPMPPGMEKKVRKQVAERLTKLVKQQQDYLEKNLPGVNRLKGRELLAFYRSRDVTYWQQLHATYPDVALAAVAEYAKLVRQFGPVRRLT